MGRKQIRAKLIFSPDEFDCLGKPRNPVRKTRKINAHWIEKGMHEPESLIMNVWIIYFTCNAAVLKIFLREKSLLPGFNHKVNDHHTTGN
jgi:hypothetical protein